MPLLGLDVGTGGSRAVLVDRDGMVLASATCDHVPFASPHAGWAEQDPVDWWRASADAIRAVHAHAPDRAIEAIGLSGQMHGAVLLDAQDQVVRPALLWCDQRTGRECRDITDTIGAERLIELTANPALTGFTLPKLLWVRRHEPEAWQRIRAVLLPKDYVRLRLTGVHATDLADASGTLLCDVAHRQWSDDLLAALHLDPSWLPRAFEGPEVAGVVSAEAARRTGLPEGTPTDAGRPPSAFVAYRAGGLVERYELQPGGVIVAEARGVIHGREPLAQGERVTLLSIAVEDAPAPRQAR